MTVQTGASATESTSSPPDVQSLYQEGIVAGLLAAGAVAIWFLIVDTVAGRPFYTPSVLGTVLFGRGIGLDPVPVSFSMVAMFTWVHGMVFAVLGGIASRLLAVVEKNPSVGFGVLLLFVLLQSGFTVTAAFLAAPIFAALGWPSIFVANLLAAGVMALYFRLRHPNLSVRP
jgi:hypothetical protein